MSSIMVFHLFFLSDWFILLLHFQGFPSICWDSGKNKCKYGSLSLLLSSTQFEQYVHQLFPKLEGRRPNFFKLDTNKRATRILIDSPKRIKEMKYFGCIIVTTDEIVHYTSMITKIIWQLNLLTYKLRS